MSDKPLTMHPFESSLVRYIEADITRLTAEVERLLSVTVVQETLIRKSEAANEKLRAGLWDIHAYCNNWDWFIWMWPMRHIKRYARAALSGDKHE